jgi:hypothetical protein
LKMADANLDVSRREKQKQMMLIDEKVEWRS